MSSLEARELVLSWRCPGSQGWRAQQCGRAGEAEGRAGCCGRGWPGRPWKPSCLQSHSGFWGLGWPTWGLGDGQASWRRLRGPWWASAFLELRGWATLGRLWEAGPRPLAEAAGRPWPGAHPVHLGVRPGPCGWAAGSAGSSYSRGHRLLALLAPLPAHVGRRFQGLSVGGGFGENRVCIWLGRAFCGSLCRRLVKAMLRL